MTKVPFPRKEEELLYQLSLQIEELKIRESIDKKLKRSIRVRLLFSLNGR
jgi:hypothetical protein